MSCELQGEAVHQLVTFLHFCVKAEAERFASSQDGSSSHGARSRAPHGARPRRPSFRPRAHHRLLRPGGHQQERHHGRLLHLHHPSQRLRPRLAGEVRHQEGELRRLPGPHGPRRLHRTPGVSSRGDQHAPHAPARVRGADGGEGEAQRGSHRLGQQAVHEGAAQGRRLRLPERLGALPDQSQQQDRRCVCGVQQLQSRDYFLAG